MKKKGKCEKMAEIMKSCFTGEGNMADCRSMMRKMMECNQGEKAEKKEKNAQEAE
jgi:hypothetical protein